MMNGRSFISICSFPHIPQLTYDGPDEGLGAFGNLGHRVQVTQRGRVLEVASGLGRSGSYTGCTGRWLGRILEGGWDLNGTRFAEESFLVHVGLRRIWTFIITQLEHEFILLFNTVTRLDCDSDNIRSCTQRQGDSE